MIEGKMRRRKKTKKDDEGRMKEDVMAEALALVGCLEAELIRSPRPMENEGFVREGYDVTHRCRTTTLMDLYKTGD